VHYFLSARISQSWQSQNHCLLPRENSHNQPQQAKAVPAQKSSKGTVKCKRQAGHLWVKTGRVQFLQMPVFSRYFVQQMPGLLLQIPALRSIAI